MGEAHLGPGVWVHPRQPSESLSEEKQAKERGGGDKRKRKKEGGELGGERGAERKEWEREGKEGEGKVGNGRKGKGKEGREVGEREEEERERQVKKWGEVRGLKGEERRLLCSFYTLSVSLTELVHVRNKHSVQCGLLSLQFKFKAT